MTEDEWLTGNDPWRMVDFLNGNASDRKLRLFGCACCRVAWTLMVEPYVQEAVVFSEVFADDSTVLHKLEQAREQVNDLNMEEFDRGWCGGGIKPGLWYRTAAVLEATGIPVRAAFVPAKLALAAAEMGAVNPLIRIDIELVRDIFGNPFHPIVADPSWLTPTVVSIAEAIYQDRAFDRLPILADALEEAGCTNADLLLHCRQPGEHVRGCWVVDLLLGKE